MAFTGPALPQNLRASWCPAWPARGHTLSHASYFHSLAWGQPVSPRPCMRHAGHGSQLEDLTPPHPDTRHATPMTGPTPLGSLVETGAPCSEAVLLRGIIKRQEDIGAQALAEWSRPELQVGETGPQGTHTLLPCAPISPTQVCCQLGTSCRSRTEVAAPAPASQAQQSPQAL